MNQPTYLKPWLAGWSWGSRLALLFILLSAIVEFVVFALSQNYVIAYLGAQPEDVTFSIQICYAGILATLPLQPRLLRWFEMKYYLLFWITIGIGLAAACIYTTDLTLFFMIRFGQGAVVCAVAASALTLIPGVIKMELRQAVTPSIFYGTILSSSVLIAIVTAQVSVDTNFTAVYVYLILFQLIALAIVLFGFSDHSNIRRYPLYQLDWTGSVFLMTAVIGMAYFMVYGPKYYWFTDRRIIAAALISLTAAVLYIYRSLTIKRPLLDLSVFAYPKFWVGLALLVLYYGLKESINLVFGFTGGILQWSPPQVVELGLVNVAGLLLFLVIAATIKIRKKNAMFGFLLVGFSLSLSYHLWMYFIFSSDLAFNDLIGPMFLQGAASGLLFVPIMIFIISSVPPATGISSLAVAAVFRFVSLLNAGAGFYTLNLYYNQLYKESFLAQLTNTDDNTTERLNIFRQVFLSRGFAPGQAEAMANASLNKALAVQAQLLGDRAVFLYVAGITGVVLVVTAASYLFKRFYTPFTTKPAL